MNLNRTEELEIKRDLGRIRKALEEISDKMVPAEPITQVVVKDGDPFFGKIHMSQEHMDAWVRDFKAIYPGLVNLMEECAELQQASSKYYRKFRDEGDNEKCAFERAAMIEEMAHVLIDIRMIGHALDISPEELQQEIYKKYPDGYNLTAMIADNKPVYYVERNEGLK